MVSLIGSGRGRWVVAMFCGWMLAPSVGWAQDDIFDDNLTSEGGESADSFGGDDLGLDEAGEGMATDPNQAREQYEQRLAEAMSTLQQRDFQAALAIFQELSQLSAGDPRVLLGIGICYFETGSVDLAINSLSMALVSRGAAQVPGLVESANVFLGQAYLQKGRYRESQQKLGNARQANPLNPEANMLFGKATLRLSLRSVMDQNSQAQISQAVEALSQAIASVPDYGEAYLERGRALTRMRQIDYAVDDLTRAVELMGRTSEAAADLAMAYQMRASRTGREVDATTPAVVEDYRAAIATADAYLASAQFGSKVAPWDTVDPLTQTPEKVLLSRCETKISLAKELNNDESNDLYRNTINEVERIIDLPDAAEDDLARAYFTRGVCQRLLNDLPSAITSFSKSIRVYESLGASFSEAYLRRGICFFHQAHYDLAMQDFGKAESNPANPFSYEPRAMFWSGLTSAHQEDFAAAIRYYTRAISAAPNFTRAYLNRGLAYLQMARFDQALEDFDEVLRQVPDHQQAGNFRELTMQRLN